MTAKYVFLIMSTTQLKKIFKLYFLYLFIRILPSKDVVSRAEIIHILFTKHNTLLLKYEMSVISRSDYCCLDLKGTPNKGCLQDMLTD